ncbi:MAG: response regulator [Deltaproteobacteria bacterium]|nr:response regulator [Deltaproteobacteria bacterium]
MYNPRILIVEDNQGVAEALKATLEDDYNLEFVDSGEDGWNHLFFLGESFDLIIVDIVLPGFDGLELLKRIRDFNPWLPVLIITGYSTQERAEIAADRSVAGYIKKPLEVDQLKDKVRNSINLNRPVFPGKITPLLGCDPHSFHPLTRRALYEIHKKFHTNTTLENIASACTVSRYHLCRVFKKDCRVTIRDYLVNLRLEVAKELLRNSGYTVAKISDLIGYKNRAYFFKIFKRATGVTPLQFRHTSR